MKRQEEFRKNDPEFFFFTGSFELKNYPHNPTPKLATNRMQKRMTPTSHLSSKAMICSP
jgi:hypothetical protein